MDQNDLDLLQTVPTYHLQTIVKMRRIPIAPLLPNNKESLVGLLTSSALPQEKIQELAEHLFDPSLITALLRELNPFEIAIMKELVACGGQANSRDLALYLTYVGLLTPSKKAGHHPVPTPLPSEPLQPPQYPPAHAHGVFEMALRHLLILGLIFWGKKTNFGGHDYTSGTLDGPMVLPKAVKEAARLEWPSPKSPTLPLQNADVGDNARTLQRNLYLYWSLVASMHDGLPLVSSGLLTRSALRQVSELMQGQKDAPRTEAECPYLLFLRLLLMKLELLEEKHHTLYAAPAEAYFTLPLIERARRCYRLCLETNFWNEMSYLPEVNVQPGPTPLEPAQEEVIRARKAIIERLPHIPVGIWQDFATFIAHIKLQEPHLLFPMPSGGAHAERYAASMNPYGWDFRLRRGWLTHREGWHMVEGGFIRATIGGPLHWLGLTELEREKNPSAFRLSPGAKLMMSSDLPPIASETRGRLIVQPNFELMVLTPISEALLIQLDRFAERVRLEHIAQYRLTKASVTRALPRGIHCEEIVKILEQASGGEIPQNVYYSLNEWERQARRIELWPHTTILEVDDETLLDSLLADPATQSLFQRRLNPNIVEIARGNLAIVQELLTQRNYLPAITSATVPEEDPRFYEPQWKLHEDGTLQSLYAILDLYLVAEAEQFCQRDEANAYFKITATSVHRALERGITLAHIMKFLQNYCEGGIPASFLIRLKLWGNGYGRPQQIQVERSPFLRLNEEILHDLEADSEIGPLLGAEVEQASRLVCIDPNNLQQVITLLHERGFSIEQETPLDVQAKASLAQGDPPQSLDNVLLRAYDDHGLY